MSYNHTTIGFVAFDAAVNMLRTLSIYPKVEFLDKEADMGPYSERRNLRKAAFRIPWNGLSMVIEEYFASKSSDCDGVDYVDIAIYEEGERPDLDFCLEVIGDDEEDDALGFYALPEDEEEDFLDQQLDTLSDQLAVPDGPR